MATKKSRTTNYFPPLLLLLLKDPGWKKIRIRDKHPGSTTLGLHSLQCCIAVTILELNPETIANLEEG